MAERVDALGREVPEWAREAFDILAADGRAVGVLRWPADGRSDPYWADGDALIGPSVVYINSGPAPIKAAGGNPSECARNALAMEAESKAHPVHAAKVPPMDDARRAEFFGALLKLSGDHQSVLGPRPAPTPSDAPPTTYVRGPWQFVDLDGKTHTLAPERRHNATCSRCHGPAYVGLGLPRCEREGGCLADREPVVFGEAPHWKESSVFPAVMPNSETEWFYQLGTGGDYGPFITRDAAVAAWREAVLARAKREAT